MNAKALLLDLARYFDSSRRVGHTTAMMEGARNTECFILSHNQTGADFLKTLYPNGEIITISSMQRLVGKRKPLLVDNAATAAILSLALEEISRLEQKVADMKKAAQAIAEERNG